MANAVEKTIERLARRAKSEAKTSGFGQTDEGLRLIGRYFEQYVDVAKASLYAEVGSRSHRGIAKLITDTFEVEEFVAIALDAGLSAAHQKLKDSAKQSARALKIRLLGRAVEDQIFGKMLRTHDEDLAAKLEDRVVRSIASQAQRMKRLRALVPDVKPLDWGDNDVNQAGIRVLDVLISGPLFELSDSEDGPDFTYTPEAVENLEAIRSSIAFSKPLALVQTGEVVLWQEHRLRLSGAEYKFIKPPRGEAAGRVLAESKKGTYLRSMAAINHIQATRWTINPHVLGAIKAALRGEIEVPGLPTKASRALDPMPAYEDNEALWKQAKRKNDTIRNQNMANRGTYGALMEHLKLIAEIGDQPFWVPYNCDYRGRVYALPAFNFQGPDYMRALHQFMDGQILTDEGMRWLKIHLAGVYGLDKESFRAREAWATSNDDMLRSIAVDPRADLRWTKADSPFMFLAACCAYLDALKGAPVYLPVSFDGTCSGVQHLAAMTKDKDAGRSVNLCDLRYRQDIYGEIAKAANELMVREKDPEKTHIAQAWLNVTPDGVTRAMVKRPVMTFCYSSTESGRKQQIFDDTIKPWIEAEEVDGVCNPLGINDRKVLYGYAAYLAAKIGEAITVRMKGPAEAMAFFRSCAGVLAHEGKIVTWETPMGFKVFMCYPENKRKKIDLFLKGKAIMIQTNSRVDLPGIKKSKALAAIAPNVVHSYDACHLMMVAEAAAQAGINSIAFVHDSFGCHPNDAGKFRDIITNTFCDLYEEGKVLTRFADEMREQADAKEKVPAAPALGTLDINDILSSEYAFA